MSFKSSLNLFITIFLFFILRNVQRVVCSGETDLPNILFVLTDDQDLTLHGLFPMQNVQRLIGGESGATFNNAFTSSPLCCPSRASILSGMYAHNHKTTNNSVSGNCYGDYWKNNVEVRALPVLLSKGGYRTFFAGKYLNQYYGDEVPPGWDNFYGLLGNSRYYNYTLRENVFRITYSDTYLTDLLRDKFLDYLDAQVNETKPFFAMIATPAPHAPYTPADRHRNAFAGIKALRTPNFNRLPEPLEKHWLLANSRLIPQHVLSEIDVYFQQRWETLLAVDEMVAAAIKRLEKLGELYNTYIVYTSDNGYHMGQFAQPFDKRQPYETDIRVPLLIRGPHVVKGVTITKPVMLVDLLPTMMQWAGIELLKDIDGESFHEELVTNPYPRQPKKWHRSILIQHWGEGTEQTYNSDCPWAPTDRLAECTPEADCHCQDSWNNTYACIRHFREEINHLYCEFKDDENFVEAYDLNDDPYQMVNLGYEWLPIERALYSLALSNLTHCSGSSCKNTNI